MKAKKLTVPLLRSFELHLRENEKSPATVEKYLRDVRCFYRFAQGRPVDKNLVMEYKAGLQGQYAVASANSMLAALNAFFRFCGFGEFCVKQFRMQKAVYCPEEKELTKEEYLRLVSTAERNGNHRLALLIQTLCGTGMRISELQFITVEAVRRGEAVVSCKAKTRRVFLVPALRKKLLRYVSSRKISSGPVFVTGGGKPVNRSNIWREMKHLCRKAAVSPGKVFPHNLRHLFARTFYRLEKDLAKLADLLGHSSINTTRIYIVTTGSEHKCRMESMRLIL